MWIKIIQNGEPLLLNTDHILAIRGEQKEGSYYINIECQAGLNVRVYSLGPFKEEEYRTHMVVCQLNLGATDLIESIEMAKM